MDLLSSQVNNDAQKKANTEKRIVPSVGNGLPADWRDELDRELLLLRINVAIICRTTDVTDVKETAEEGLQSVERTCQNSFTGCEGVLKPSTSDQKRITFS